MHERTTGEAVAIQHRCQKRELVGSTQQVIFGKGKGRMPLQAGDKVWLSCEVKPGPFSNERLVRIQLPKGPWVGFVDTGALKEAVETGSTYVLARVTKVSGSTVTAIVQGHALDSRYVQAPSATMQKVQPGVSLPA